MEEVFTLPIMYKGQETLVEFSFRKLGYTYKISAMIGDKEVHFEPDEEGSFRATLAEPFAGREAMDQGYISAVSEKLTNVLK